MIPSRVRSSQGGAATAAVAARRGISLPSMRDVILPDHLVLALMVAAVALAGRQSLGALLPLANSDTPLSFVPLVPLFGLLFLFKRFNPAEIRGRSHDTFVDGIFFVLLLLAAGALLLLLPVTMSWDYWLDRLDIPGLVVLLSALIILAWGVPGLIRLGPALLYLLLAWPLPLLMIDNHIVPGITSLTASAARATASLLPDIAPDPANSLGLLAIYHGHVTHLIVAQACAGINSALGLVVVALPLALLGRGSWEARGIWLALGALLSWGFNVIRILLLALAVSTLGPSTSMTVLHPTVGLALFALSFALLLALARRCHLDIGAPWRKGRSATAGEGEKRSSRTWGWRRLTLMLLIVSGAALAESNLKQFDWLSDASLPTVGLSNPHDLFHAPPGWHVANADTITGWAPFFGPSTVSAVMTVAAPGQTSVGVQAILTRDESSFSTYGVENCYTFHGYQLQAVRRVPLGNGVTGTLIDFRVQSRPASALYWIQPVRTPRGLYHQRIVLITDGSRHSIRLAGVPHQAGAPGIVQPVQGFATAIAGFLSPWIGGDGGPAYTASNLELQTLGQSVIAHERQVARS